MKKICNKCLIEKEFCEFHKHRRNKDGIFSCCKKCRKQKSKINYLNNKQNNKLVITGKTCCSCMIEKDINSFHKHIGTKDGYRSICKECRSNFFKIKYKNNKNFSKKHKERTKNYRINNQEKINKYFKGRYKNRPHEYAWRGMIKSVIKRLGGKKESSTHEILGYSAVQLKKHLEDLFTEGMSWDNWGQWHIDHKKPITKFSKNDDPKIINSLSNLQPMWAEENIKKSNK